VGTRSASSYGRAAARDFARALAGAGVTVVSGGAIGNDTEAHEGALLAGKTVAVLPCGADVAYPSQNRGLFARIAQQGCVASEFEPGAPVAKGALQARNVTIARLCSAVVVVEAPVGSGALITARAAAELGKPVFVVPGLYSLSSFRGGHALLSEGALLADDPYGLAARFGSPVPSADGPADDAVAALLRAGPADPDAIVRATGLSPEAVLELLTMMEIEGRVRRAGGGYALTL
jgi:DNA processing protein